MGLITCIIVLISCKHQPDEIDIDLSDSVFPRISIQTERINEPGIVNRVRLYIQNDKGAAKQHVLLQSEHKNGILVFTPVFPLQRGNTYRIQIDWFGREIDRIFNCEPITSLDTSPLNIETYPITDKIPQNVLQFHLVFSEPMIRVLDAYEKVEIRDSNGKVLPYMWREKSDWNENGTHLALMVHPGRVKRGISFQGKEHSPFIPGQSYTLVLTSPLRTVSGRTTTTQVLKVFTSVSNDYKLPKIVSKGFDSSKLGYYVQFNEAMDFGTVVNGLHLKKHGEYLKLMPESEDDHTWIFITKNTIPSSQMHVEEIVSDLSANRLHRLFEEKRLKKMRNRNGIELDLP